MPSQPFKGRTRATLNMPAGMGMLCIRGLFDLHMVPLPTSFSTPFT
jgi:hypothetical protein